MPERASYGSKPHGNDHGPTPDSEYEHADTACFPKDDCHRCAILNARRRIRAEHADDPNWQDPWRTA